MFRGKFSLVKHATWKIKRFTCAHIATTKSFLIWIVKCITIPGFGPCVSVWFNRKILYRFRCSYIISHSSGIVQYKLLLSLGRIKYWFSKGQKEVACTTEFLCMCGMHILIDYKSLPNQSHYSHDNLQSFLAMKNRIFPVIFLIFSCKNTLVVT